MSEDILTAIDAAVQANLCGCGCGQQIPDRGPSPDFVNEKHQQAWTARGYRASGGKIAADWYTRLTDLPPCGNAHHDGSSWGCRECTPRHPVYDDETPMGRVVRETSSLRRAIDRILGKSR